MRTARHLSSARGPAPLLGSAVLAACSAVVTVNAAANEISDGKFLMTMGPTPQWVDVAPVSSLLNTPQAVKVDYLLISRQERMDKSGELTRYARYVTQPLSRAGLDEESTVKLSYSPGYQQVILHDLAITRGDNTEQRIDSADVRFVQEESQANSRIYSGQVTVNITPQDLRVGDRIDVSYSIIGRNPIYGEKVFSGGQTGWNVPVSHLQLRYHAPTGRELYAEAYNGSQALKHSTEGDWQVYSLDVNNTEASDFENDYPSWDFPYPWVRISEFKSWKNVSAWFNTLFEIEPPASPAFNKLVQELNRKSNGKDDAYLLEALDFVQEEISYISLSIGENSHKPRHPDEVLEKRFGDCKDKTLLLMALLDAKGIEARPALVSTNQRERWAEYLPSPASFDHAIAEVKLDGTQYWFDATRTYQEGTLASLVNSDFGAALPLSERGDRPKPMQRSEQQAPTIQVTERFELSDFLSPPKLYVTTIFGGQHAEFYRYQMDNRNRREMSRWLRDYYARYYSGAEDNVEYIFEDDRELNQFTLIEQYELHDFWESDQNTVKASFYHTGLWDKLEFPDHARRETSFNPSDPVTVDYRIEVNFDESSQFELEDASLKLKTEGVEYRSFARARSGRYEMDAHLKLSSHSVPPDRLADYIKTMKGIKEDSSYSLTFELPLEISSKKDVEQLLIRLQSSSMD